MAFGFIKCSKVARVPSKAAASRPLLTSCSFNWAVGKHSSAVLLDDLLIGHACRFLRMSTTLNTINKSAVSEPK